MSVAALVALIATPLIVQPHADTPDAPPALGAVSSAPEVTAADAARLGRMLEALADYETDQRTIAALFGIAAGAGAAASGLVLATDASAAQTNRSGPILIGVGAGVALSGVVMLFIDGSGRELADAFARDAMGSPEARLEATRVAEAGLVELRDDTETGRYVVGALLMLLGTGTGVLGGALLADDSNDALRTTSAISISSGAGLAVSGLYLLAFGKTPVEQFIDGYTLLTIGQAPEGGTLIGVGGKF